MLIKNNESIPTFINDSAKTDINTYLSNHVKKNYLITDAEILTVHQKVDQICKYWYNEVQAAVKTGNLTCLVSYESGFHLDADAAKMISDIFCRTVCVNGNDLRSDANNKYNDKPHALGLFISHKNIDYRLHFKWTAENLSIALRQNHDELAV